jgi:hypothetical protein
MVCLSGKRGYLCLSISRYGEAVIGGSAGEWMYWTDLLVLRVDVLVLDDSRGARVIAATTTTTTSALYWRAWTNKPLQIAWLTSLRRQRQIDRVGLCGLVGCQQSACAISQQRRLGSGGGPEELSWAKARYSRIGGIGDVGVSCREWFGQLGGNGSRLQLAGEGAWACMGDVRPARRFDVADGGVEEWIWMLEGGWKRKERGEVESKDTYF